jgi:cysteine-rich repeat protein
MYAPDPVQGGSSVSHFSNALTPNELMEPSYTGPELDPRLAVDLLVDTGWRLFDSTCGNGVIDAGEQCDDANTISGDCCSASCQLEAAGSTCTDDGDACTADTCDGSGVCTHNAVPNGTACDDGVACTTGETCQAGVCTSGAPPCDDGESCTADTCEVSDCFSTEHGAGCNDPVCEAIICANDVYCCNTNWDNLCVNGGGGSNGAVNECAGRESFCANNESPDGTPCDDGDPATGGDVCTAGVCAGTPDLCAGVTCTALDQCHAVGTCDPATGLCSDPSLPNGTGCDDGNACTVGDVCTAGVCSGAPVDCTGLDSQCTTGVCNAATGNCESQAANEGGVCDDGLFCTSGETCSAGACGGGGPTCDDGVGCTSDACDEIAGCTNTPDDGLCDNGAFCDGGEVCDAVSDCVSGADPCPGQSCDEAADQCLAGPVAKLETVETTAGGAPVTVLLANTYISPVVVCSVQYVNNTVPVVARVSSVSSSSFAVRLQNPSDAAVASESISCLVVEEGVWTVDGVNLEAARYTSTVTDGRNSWNGEARTYGQQYALPVVVGQVMTENDPRWSVFWARGGSRQTPPSATELFTGKSVAEDFATTRANETVGYLVIESGHGTLGGVEYEAAIGADIVRGVGNAPPYTYAYQAQFATAPTTSVVSSAAMDGNDGGWPHRFGAPASTANQLSLGIDEDQIRDTERSHATEQVAYAAFAGDLVLIDCQGQLRRRRSR